MPSSGKYLELRVSYRSILVVVVVAVVVAVVISWLMVATRQTVTTGSAASLGNGVWLNTCVPGDAEDGALYPSSKDVVAVQTVRNGGRWAVEVVSKKPGVFRFGSLAELPEDDYLLPDPRDGAPDKDETSDRMVIPPGREVAMWIVDPFPEATIRDGYSGISTAPVMVSFLGVSHETTIDLRIPIWVGDGDVDRDRLEVAFDEVCDALNG